ncbi:unnamed protein product [Schistocephalus solidus]|uniref:Transmembrane protein n=1 Tax=Schistocephalus solidus TaxID=70667 RepID=A0A183SJ86_SCHSO|nr:unnamed protein product [Schistocephalus solidus]
MNLLEGLSKQVTTERDRVHAGALCSPFLGASEESPGRSNETVRLFSLARIASSSVVFFPPSPPSIRTALALVQSKTFEAARILRYLPPILVSSLAKNFVSSLMDVTYPVWGEESLNYVCFSNDRKAFCILYLSTMAAASIAVSVQAMDESKDGLTAVVHDMLLGTLYATSTGILFFITIYFCLRRKQTFEAAQNSTGPVPFIVKYSCHGEPINLYLRIGLAVFTLMSIGQNSVQIAEIAGDRSTHWPEVYKSAFEMSFYVCQTTFILVYHRVSASVALILKLMYKHTVLNVVTAVSLAAAALVSL